MIPCLRGYVNGNVQEKYMQHITFKKNLHLKLWLIKRHEGLDPTKTMQTARMNLIGKDGVYHKCTGAKNLCQVLNEHFGGDYDVKLSYSAGSQKCTLFYGVDVEPTLPEEDVSSGSVVEALEDIVEDVVQGTDTVEEIIEDTTPTVDWDWVATLDNTKEGKLALDEYVSSKFNIHLSRTMKLENMIKDFREKLES
ncbi:hypothetical protein VPHG_00132 [Vibrio phage 11895-B1]|uniref:hypothetical protein n=1 Tax=Vibrio phage 11895-B1 TaxID=754075 RepID=UPI0002C153E6|nr:hypothetical protein VPHG_00132 [Vibrio phage 11895-B1]AGH32198.1 hypothetical protein VPHG_00132 [Vibrio phage 11895-B1]